jgi:hypothetical protein
MKIGAFALVLASLLAPGLSFSQQSGSGTTATTPTKKHSHGGASNNVSGGGVGGGGGGGRKVNDSGVSEMQDLPCPKGFTAVTDSAPHLQLSATQQSGRRNAAATKQTSGRRCVADKPVKKPSTATASASKAQ